MDLFCAYRFWTSLCFIALSTFRVESKIQVMLHNIKHTSQHKSAVVITMSCVSSSLKAQCKCRGRSWHHARPEMYQRLVNSSMSDKNLKGTFTQYFKIRIYLFAMDHYWLVYYETLCIIEAICMSQNAEKTCMFSNQFLLILAEIKLTDWSILNMNAFYFYFSSKILKKLLLLSLWCSLIHLMLVSPFTLTLSRLHHCALALSIFSIYHPAPPDALIWLWLSAGWFEVLVTVLKCSVSLQVYLL